MKSLRRRDIDRRTWASPTTIVFAYETIGSGSFLTPELDFGLSYEGSPFFSFGSSLVTGELTDGDYPFITVGVAEWLTKEVDDEDFAIKGIKLEHVGAILWVSVSSSTAYTLSHNLVFEGVAYKNPMVR